MSEGGISDSIFCKTQKRLVYFPSPPIQSFEI